MDLFESNTNTSGESSGPHWSDIQEVISGDLKGPAARETALPMLAQTNSSNATAQVTNKPIQEPYIRIVEQPASRSLRFRYECEGRSAGSIPGVNSTNENKTFPTIEIVNCPGKVKVLVSCVTHNPPYRPHPHQLVGKGCEEGICIVKLEGEGTKRAVFSNLGIRCVKRRDIKKSLEVREKFNVNPYKTKFDHNDIDLNVVRLCFQAFVINGPESRPRPLKPVVTEPICDKKHGDLRIYRLCSCEAKVDGGDEIILLCEKVAKDDVQVRFYETDDKENVIWEEYAKFEPTDVHKQTAIAFKTPRYRTGDIKGSAKVYIQLVRPSDGKTSEPLPFEYHPDPENFKRKRLRRRESTQSILERALVQAKQNENCPSDLSQLPTIATTTTCTTNNYKPEIKIEPVVSPINFENYRSPPPGAYMMTPSPQPPMSPLNRNVNTPSPGLLQFTNLPPTGTQHIQDKGQAMMCQQFNSSLSFTQLSPNALQQQQQQGYQEQQQNGNYNFNNNHSNLNIINSSLSGGSFERIHQQPQALSPTSPFSSSDTNNNAANLPALSGLLGYSDAPATAATATSQQIEQMLPQFVSNFSLPLQDQQSQQMPTQCEDVSMNFINNLLELTPMEEDLIEFLNSSFPQQNVESL